jgi:hypothetical protein
MTEEESTALIMGDRLEWLGDPFDHGTVIGVSPHHIRIRWDSNHGSVLMHRTDLEQLTLVKD